MRDLAPDDGDLFRPLYRAGAGAAFAMLALVPVQMVIFLVWPPPATATGILELYQRNTALGLLSLDLVYAVDMALTALLTLALCAALRRASPVLATLALTASLVGTAVYFASTPVFSMLVVSSRHGAATSDAERSALQGAAEALVATYMGGANGSAYALLTIGGLCLAFAMLRSHVFTRATGVVALVVNLLMVVPSGAGKVGMVMSLASLPPLLVWWVLVALRLLRLGRGAPPARAAVAEPPPMAPGLPAPS